MRLIPTGLCLLVLLAGCGDSESPDTAEPTPGVPPSAKSYSSVEALKDAAVKAGYYCPSWKQDDVVTLAAESGHCSDYDVFATFASEADLQSHLETQRELEEMLAEAGGSDPMLVGPNWTITSPSAPDLVDHLGGTVSR